MEEKTFVGAVEVEQTASSRSFTPAMKGRIIAALKATNQTPEQIAAQADISVETLAQWTRECMGLPDEGQTPKEIFGMFQSHNIFADFRKKLFSSPSKKAGEFKQYKSSQLCWNCVHAVPDAVYGCPWSKDFEPVEGWRAEKTNNSYRITNCPLFELG